MAPNHNGALGSAFLDTNRHSPRIFNKNSMKFDVSMANDKIGFMRSLNLVCTKNTKEFQSKLNWEVVSPGVTLPLKECSVVLTNVSCNASGELLNNDTDLLRHKKLLSQFNVNECKDEDLLQKQQTVERTCTQPIDKKTLESLDKIEAVISNARKRKSSSGVTLKVTLKIGDEVISKKYCKKKYLAKESPDERIIRRSHKHIDCEKCNDIQNSLNSSRDVRPNITNCDDCDVKNSNVESSTQNVSKEKWFMAAALVEYEMQRLRALKSQTYGRNDLHNGDIENINNDNVDEKSTTDALVPEANEVMPSNIPIEDDIEEVLRLTRNSKTICNNSTNTFQQNRLTPNNNYEIITIDDDCDDLMDDCVIISESLSHNHLKDKENSYEFYMLDTEKRENRTNSCFDDGRIFKRQQFHHIDSQIFNFSTKNNLSFQSSLECNKI